MNPASPATQILPSMPVTSPPWEAKDSQDNLPDVTLDELFRTQLKLVASVQGRLFTSADSMTSRDFRDLVSVSSNVLALAHRTESLQKTIATLELFSATVLEFLKSRSDTVGEDLVARLKEVARGLNAEKAVDEVVQRVG